MALVKGLGTCLIQKESGVPCGLQIQEGEPIGTVVVGSWTAPIVGHKRCADDYNMRKNMVKKYDQKGAAGAVDFSTPQDMVEGSIPLETTRDGKVSDAEPVSVGKAEDIPHGHVDLTNVRMPEGVIPLSDLPMTEEPAPAPEPERNIYREGYNPPPTEFTRLTMQPPSIDPRFETERDELYYLRGYQDGVRQERANRG